MRTHVRIAPKPDFESGAFNHSATLPRKPLLKAHCAAFRANTLCVRLRQGQAHSPVAFDRGIRDSRGPDAGRVDSPFAITLPKLRHDYNVRVGCGQKLAR